MSFSNPDVKGMARDRTQKTTRARRSPKNQKPPRAFWLDVGKFVSLELTASRFGFAYSDNYPTAKMDVDLFGPPNHGGEN